MDNYTMSFADVLNEVFDTNGWYQGENFKAGVYLKLNQFGDIGLFEFTEDSFGETFVGTLAVSQGIIRQNYKRVYTQPEIMHKIK